MDGITGGYVLFGKTVKTGDFENEKSEVRLDFNDPKVFDEAGEKAKEKALDLLGKGVIKRKVGRPPTTPKTETADPAAVSEGPLAPAAATTGTQTGASVSLAQSPVTQTGAAKAEPVVSVADPAAVEEWEPKAETAAPILDKDMVSAFAKKVNSAENKNEMAAKIKAVIATYVKLPQTAKDIPVSQRADFMKKIEAL